MPKVISVHSYRGGTGKSNLTANLATILAGLGNRVGIIDTDIQSPGIHVVLGLEEEEIGRTLNDYLWGECSIDAAAHDVGIHNGCGHGRLYLVPSSPKTGEIARVLRQGFDVGLLNDGFKRLIQALHLDYLFIDTHPGINDETLLSTAVSDVLVLVLRPDRQDFQGTAVTVQLARKLQVPQVLLLINRAQPSLNRDALRAQAEQIYETPVAGILPLSEEMINLASSGLFTQKYPDHFLTRELHQVASQLIG